MMTRSRLSRTRNAIHTTITIVETFNREGEPRGPLDIDITAGEFDDGRIGELFVQAGKSGSKTSGLVDATCIAVSIGLQYGVPLREYSDKLTQTRYPPDGFVEAPIGPDGQPKLRTCTSIHDAVFRWLATIYDLDTGARLSQVPPAELVAVAETTPVAVGQEGANTP